MKTMKQLAIMTLGMVFTLGTTMLGFQGAAQGEIIIIHGSVCNGHGELTWYATCDCESGWSGKYCETWIGGGVGGGGGGGATPPDGGGGGGDGPDLGEVLENLSGRDVKQMCESEGGTFLPFPPEDSEQPDEETENPSGALAYVCVLPQGGHLACSSIDDAGYTNEYSCVDDVNNYNEVISADYYPIVSYCASHSFSIHSKLGEYIMCDLATVEDNYGGGALICESPENTRDYECYYSTEGLTPLEPGWYASAGGTTVWQKLNHEEITLEDLEVSKLAFGDFDGDGTTDLFRTTGSKWYVSYNGSGTWQQMRTSGVTLSHLAFGDFDGDGRTDVFYPDGRTWKVSYGGTSAWQQIRVSNIRLADIALGDFDGDGRTDVFRPTGSRWYVSYGGTSAWQQIRVSNIRLADIALGDFDGDGRTDVFRTTGSRWYISYSGTSAWQEVRRSPLRRSLLAVGDFNGDGSTDIFRATGSKWYVSYSGTSPWQELNTSEFSLADLAFGDFDGNGTTDVFYAGFARDLQ